MRPIFSSQKHLAEINLNEGGERQKEVICRFREYQENFMIVVINALSSSSLPLLSLPSSFMTMAMITIIMIMITINLPGKCCESLCNSRRHEANISLTRCNSSQPCDINVLINICNLSSSTFWSNFATFGHQHFYQNLQVVVIKMLIKICNLWSSMFWSKFATIGHQHLDKNVQPLVINIFIKFASFGHKH